MRFLNERREGYASELVFGLLSSLFFFVVFLWLFGLLSRAGVRIDFGGDKSFIFLPLLVGFPLGNAAGFYVAQRLHGVQRRPPFATYIVALLVAFVSLVLGGMLFFWLSNSMSTLIVLPVFVTVSCWVGFRWTLARILSRQNRGSPSDR